MIFVEKDEPLSREEIDRRLETLCTAVRDDTEENGFAKVREAFFKVVPSYKKPCEVNGACETEKNGD